jgi:biotin carboxyl carrier protein
MYKARVGKQTFEFEFSDNTCLVGTVNGVPFQMDLMNEKWAQNVIHDHKSYSISIVGFRPKEKSCVIQVNNQEILVSIEDRFDILLKQLGMDSVNNKKVNEIKAPMPGLVLSLNVSLGDSVAQGDSLLVLEAMKMENIIKSPSDGIVKSIEVVSSQAVEKNQVLIRFEL